MRQPSGECEGTRRKYSHSSLFSHSRLQASLGKEDQKRESITERSMKNDHRKNIFSWIGSRFRCPGKFAVSTLWTISEQLSNRLLFDLEVTNGWIATQFSELMSQDGGAS